jgi:hypothetical protein
MFPLLILRSREFETRKSAERKRRGPMKLGRRTAEAAVSTGVLLTCETLALLAGRTKASVPTLLGFAFGAPVPTR